MKLKTNTLIQIAGMVAQYANVTAPILPAKHQHWATLAIAGAQTIAAVVGHFSNPDGTPARASWEPKKKERKQQ